ncbi:MAG: hypothetical protein LBD76_03290 [Prevotellaceae bacterium]|nr:hypothetical protein [Prevotellaceae bacterium]
MNRMIHNKKWLFAGFLLLLFCCYRVSITCFVHSHIVNGRLITHSHPYRGVPDNPGHSHNAAQLLLIEFLSHIVIMSVVLAAIAHVFSGKIFLRQTSCAFICKHAGICSYSLRAPPCNPVH